MRTCQVCGNADKLALSCAVCGNADWHDVQAKPGESAPACACGAALVKGAISCPLCGVDLRTPPAAPVAAAAPASAEPAPAPEPIAPPAPVSTPDEPRKGRR